MTILSSINRTVTVLFLAVLLTSVATAKEKEAAKSSRPNGGAAAEYVSHAIALAKKEYWSETGFTISPSEIFDKFAGLGEDVRQDERMRELYSENSMLWKQVAPVLAKKYAELEKEINHSRFSAMERYRAELSRILTQLLEARGGGSASAVLYALIPAEAEWILKQMAVQQTKPTSDQDFESALTRSVVYWDEAECRRRCSDQKGSSRTAPRGTLHERAAGGRGAAGDPKVFSGLARFTARSLGQDPSLILDTTGQDWLTL